MEYQFDNWYHSPSARKRFTMFIDYLFEDTDQLCNISCADFSFNHPVGNDHFDADWLKYTLHPDSQRLIDFGLHSNRYLELNFEME